MKLKQKKGKRKSYSSKTGLCGFFAFMGGDEFYGISSKE